MPVYTDQLGHSVAIANPPQRIISLVPSQTELLHSLGLDQQVVGITKFCIHPNTWFREKTRIGGTKDVHIDLIDQLNPDLIIANKEENVKEQVEALGNKYPVWTSDVNTLADALHMVEQIGTITNTTQEATRLIHEIRNGFQQLVTPRTIIPTAYLIWRNPYMTVGAGTFIHHMLQYGGFSNVFAHRTRYPAISIEDLQASNCRLLLLSSEPYPFKQKHIEELQGHLPNTKIILVDGELFSWYGSRLLYAPAYLMQLTQQLSQYFA